MSLTMYDGLMVNLSLLLQHQLRDNRPRSGPGGKGGSFRGMPEVMVSLQLSFYSEDGPLQQWESEVRSIRGLRLWTRTVGVDVRGKPSRIELDLRSRVPFEELLALTALDPLTRVIEAGLLQDAAVAFIDRVDEELAQARKPAEQGEWSHSLTLGETSNHLD